MMQRLEYNKNDYVIAQQKEIQKAVVLGLSVQRLEKVVL
jgi:hypothetical protein